MTHIVALFDDPLALEDAVKQLSLQDFQPRVVDPSAPVESGAQPLVGVLDGIAGQERPEQARRGRAAGRALADADVPTELADFYRQSVEHGAKLLIVDADREHAEQATALLRSAGGSRVERID